MPPPSALVRTDGHLTAHAVVVLQAVTGVEPRILEAARVRRSSDNWIHAPWYRYHRGGAITVGRVIWFTRKWFEADGYGDGTPLSTWNWLLHLAHEVGHLQQAERYGLHLLGKVRYVCAFVVQYGKRALLLKDRIHDGAPLEIEADRGRWVLAHLAGDRPLSHPLVRALHHGDANAVHEQCINLSSRITELTAAYRSCRTTGP